MVDPKVLAEARNELSRVTKFLSEAHLEAERCRLRCSRLEGEKTRAQALVDMLELAQRLADRPPEPAPGSFHIRVDPETGAKFVVVDKPAVPSAVVNGLDSSEPFGVRLKPAPAQHKRKPDGLPFTEEMVAQALEASTGRGLRPREIADFIREKWWPEIPSGHVRSAVCHMVQRGKLERDGERYRLNGVRVEA